MLERLFQFKKFMYVYQQYSLSSSEDILEQVLSLNINEMSSLGMTFSARPFSRHLFYLQQCKPIKELLLLSE